MISLETIFSYWNIGFKLVPLDELSKSPVIAWSEIYDNPDFWSIEKIREYTDKFYNVATTFGKSHVKDTQGKELHLYCLDIDSDEVLNRVQSLLEQEWKLKTFVTKTQKDCGYHVYWFEHSSDNSPIVIEDCRKGYEYEIKCGKSLCTLPPSRHRDNPLFHYENVGQSDRIIVADGLYQHLVNELLADCFRRKKNIKSKKHNTTKKGSNKSASESSITSQEEDNIQTTVTPPNNKLDHYLTNSSAAITKGIVLTDEQIQMSNQHLLPYYHEHARHKFTFGFSGLTYKQNIAEESAAKIIESICGKTDDPDATERLDTLHRTYVNGAQNGSDAITGKTKLKEVIMHVSNCDDKAAENIIQGLLKIWNGEKDEDEKHIDHNYNYENNDDNSNTKECSSKVEPLLLNELLAADIHNPAEYVISTINKTVKLDDSLVRAVFYAGCSTWTFDPINLGLSAPTSEGKTYTVLQTLQYFSFNDIRMIGSMSPKVIIRQEGILVDADTLKPIQDDIDALKEKIEENKNDKKHKRELQEELQDLVANTRLLIDLRGKIYVFLEAPDPDLWKIIKPIMSHDNFVIEHPYVESNTFQGIHVRSIITLGFPTFIFCTAKDESRWEQWDEIASRSLVISPNMSRIKYREANILNAQLLGLPTAIQESVIRSRKDIELAKKCVLYLKLSVTKAATINASSDKDRDFRYNNPVWIPYAEILGNTLPADKGTEMRINRRLLLLLRIITLTKADLRYQVIFANQTLTIAAIEDLTEALYIMQNSTGLPPYKIKFFNEIFHPLYQKKIKEKFREEQVTANNVVAETGSAVENENILPNNIVTVNLTANEICDYYNLQNPKSPINSDNLRKRFLHELNFAGYIEAIDVRDGNTKKVYYPIVTPTEEATHTCITQETQDYQNIHEFFTYHKINIPIDYKPFSSDWLIFQILRLWKCGIDLGNGMYSIDNYNSAIQFLDTSKKGDEIEDNNNITSTNSSNTSSRSKITMRQFAEEYDSTATETLSRHFSKPIFANYHNKIFGDLQYIGIRQNINDENSGTPIDSSDSSVC